MSELKPCPFCGGTNIKLKVRATAIAQCESCGGMVIELAKEDAIKTWNRRAPASEGEQK